MLNLNDLTLGQIKEIKSMCESTNHQSLSTHPMVGRRCLVRTYSAGVHIGDVVAVKETEVHLKNALRLWQWKDGGLSLSVVAESGIKGGRLNKTPEIYLTNAIEIIPTTPEAEKTYVKFIEN